ncbi:Ppx/GppA phosphatase family protein [Trichlorobacter ammonificans]|uniref:Ppx/GppA phosphatase n=1 Tax=Trichlorobacter ammonificans TaxID=2916410 RepID=A0ABM9D988_9BACT|nr:exopolyphosphatase [Trichlorobacter ammonificans]CAH2031784.1 Ppx/GppA phosphatase [Trichlorobacter ammonificans]
MACRVAAIDLGTNTARLLIADCYPGGRFEQLVLSRVIIRLGGGFSRQTGLADEAIERAMRCLYEFRRQIDHRGVTDVRAVATSAVRDAANGALFVERVRRETGIPLAVIGGEVEARLTLRGITAGLEGNPEELFMFDVGGGSTEYSLARSGRPLFVESLPLGVVRLTEGKGDEAAMGEKIGRELAQMQQRMEVARLIPDPSGTVLVGTAGTATTLAAINLEMRDYDYRRVNNHVLTRNDIRRIYERLAPLGPAERLTVPGLEPGREDLIIAGILITLHTMECFGFEQMTVSDFGLLEGLLAAGAVT